MRKCYGVRNTFGDTPGHYRSKDDRYVYISQQACRYNSTSEHIFYYIVLYLSIEIFRKNNISVEAKLWQVCQEVRNHVSGKFLDCFFSRRIVATNHICRNTEQGTACRPAE